MKPHSLFLPILSLGLLPSTGVRAQEALTSAVQMDEVLQFRAQPPAGNMMGPVSWAASGRLTVDYNDNFRQRTVDPEGDVIIRPGVDLGFAWPITQRAVLSFGVGVQYRAYVEHSEYNSLEVSPDSAISLSVTAGDVVITVFNRFSYTEDVLEVDELVDRAAYRRMSNEAGVRATWTIGDWQVQGGAAHYNFWPLEDVDRGLERASQQFFLRGAYLIAPGTRTGVEGSMSITDYRYDLRRDFNSYSAGPFLSWTILNGLVLTARGGAVRYEFRGNPTIPIDTTSDSYYFGGSLSHQLTEFIRHSLSAQHGLQVGLNAEVTETTSLAYDIGWRMTDVWTVSAGGRYSLGERAGGSAGLSETFDRYVANCSFSRQITGRLSGSLSYRYTRRESNFANREYDQNLVSLGLRYVL